MNQTQQPLVSIIIPAYNVEQYIEKAIRSAMNQNYSNIEVVVVNDGSSDSTLEVINGISQQPSVMTVVDQPNRGVMLARKAGIEAARGEYLHFLDSDDYMTADAIELLYAAMSQSDLDIVCSGHYRTSQAYTIEIKPNTSGEILSGNKFLLSLITNEMEGFLCGRLYRKGLFTDLKYPKELSLAEDKYLNIQIAAKMPRVGVIEQPTFYYVKRLESITHQHQPLEYHFNLADLIESELKLQLHSESFAEVVNHIVVMRLKFYYLYINSTSNPSVADNPQIRKLYKDIEVSDLGDIISSSFTCGERAVIALHKRKSTAWLGKVLTTLLRIKRSIAKRLNSSSSK